MSSSDRRSYLTATVLDQDFLDACADNLECRLEMVCDIESPDGVIHASDRNKYVDGVFYEALLVFPTITRTVGEWLSNELQFSTLSLTLSNVDGRFNKYLQGGAAYAGWIGKTVTVRIGLAEQGSTYTTVFNGTVTPVGGFKRSIDAITIIARDHYDPLNLNFPVNIFTAQLFPKMEERFVGKPFPAIYGDWTVGLSPIPAAVPGFILNGHDPFVHFTEVQCTLFTGSPGVVFSEDCDLDEGALIQFTTTGSLPSPLVAGLDYYVRSPSADQFYVSLTSGGSLIDFSGPQTGTQNFLPGSTALRQNVQIALSDNDLLFLGTVYLVRQDVFTPVPTSEIANVTSGSRRFEISQSPTLNWVEVDGVLSPFKFAQGDDFAVLCKGKDLGTGYSDNIVEIGRDILMTYGHALTSDFHANWDTYRDKATPAQSAIANIKARAWVGETNQAITYVLSLFEQVRLEAFIDRDLKLKINSLHFEDWVATPSFSIRNWDVEEGSFQTSIDDKNNFNRAQAVYSLLPQAGEESRATAIYKNVAAITQSNFAPISKKITFPQLYVEQDVINQLVEILKLASATLETVMVNLTWRALLKDIGDFLSVNVSIGSSKFSNVPAMIRDIGYDPTGLKIPVRLWSMQMVPFSGWAPGYEGIVGGADAVITPE